jgi:GH15 family glucan-1,4-alpha-glucosidase
MNGSIDWLCCPSFDSPSVFAAILDDKKGGHFKIAPTVKGITHKQFYWPETNVLITRFLSADGVGEITDYMPIARSEKGTGHHQVILRHSTTPGMTIRCS